MYDEYDNYPIREDGLYDDIDEDIDGDSEDPGLQIVTVTVRLLVQPGVYVEDLMEKLEFEFTDEDDSIFEAEIQGYTHDGEDYVK